MYPSEVPSEFRSCVSGDGRTLSLAYKELESVPDWLGDLTGLTTLDLRGNRLTAVPDWLGVLTALTTLDLRFNQLTTLPESLGNLTALTTLALRYNQLTTVPESLGNLTALTTLQLGENLLTAVPESLGNLTALTTLQLSGNKLIALPESLGNLTVLTTLDLERNQLTAVPESLGNLTALTKLNLEYNQLTTRPEWLKNPTARTPVNLEYNQPTSLPESSDPAGRGDEAQSETPPVLVADEVLTESAAYLLAGRRSDVLLTSEVISDALPLTGRAMGKRAQSKARSDWPGEFLDRAWMRLRSLFVPSVSLAAVLIAADMDNSAAAVLQLYTWERDRLLTLAKGAAGAAITVLTGLIATAVEGKAITSSIVLYLAAALVAGLLFWGGFLLTGLRRLAEEYTAALELTGAE